MYSENDFRLYHGDGKWSWPNGNNSKEYNSWYYNTHKDQWKEYGENAKKKAGEKAKKVASDNINMNTDQTIYYDKNGVATLDPNKAVKYVSYGNGDPDAVKAFEDAHPDKKNKNKKYEEYEEKGREFLDQSYKFYKNPIGYVIGEGYKAYKNRTLAGR